MASVILPGVFNIEYSIIDKRIRLFELGGDILYHEEDGIEKWGWQEALAQVLHDHSLDVDRGKGIYGFVQHYLETGKFKTRPRTVN